MTRCTACQAAVPSDSTFFAASGEVCARCHTYGEIAERAARAENEDFDSDVGIQLGAFHFGTGGLTLSFDTVWPQRIGRPTTVDEVDEVDEDDDEAVARDPWRGLLLGSAMVFVVVSGLVGGFVSGFGVSPVGAQVMVACGLWVHVVLFAFAAVHLLGNRRLSVPKTAAWASFALYFPTVGLFAYIVMEMLRGDRAADAELDWAT